MHHQLQQNQLEAEFAAREEEDPGQEALTQGLLNLALTTQDVAQLPVSQVRQQSVWTFGNAAVVLANKRRLAEERVVRRVEIIQEQRVAAAKQGLFQRRRQRREEQRSFEEGDDDELLSEFYKYTKARCCQIQHEGIIQYSETNNNGVDSVPNYESVPM